VARIKATSSTGMPFKTSGVIQRSPCSVHTHRYSMNKKHQQNSTNTLNITGGGGQIMAKTNSNNMTRHAGVNVYTHNGPISFRLTNV
jgi:hypothetical protein